MTKRRPKLTPINSKEDFMAHQQRKRAADPQHSCARCGSNVTNGRCEDVTCPFSDCDQSDPRGWAGHPEMDRSSR